MGGLGGRGRRAARGHARARSPDRRGQARGTGLEHGRDPARGRRGRRARDREPGARARLGRQAGVRPDADPRALGRPGRGRDGLLFDGASGRAGGERRERAALLGVVGIRCADCARPQGARDAGRRAPRRAGRPLLLGGQLPGRPARPAPGARIARTHAASHPYGHRHFEPDARRAWGSGARASGRDPLRDPGRRHGDLDRAPGDPEPGDPGPADLRSARRVGGAARARGEGSA